MGHAEFEKMAMQMLLAGSENILKQLRKQYDVCGLLSREFTGVGFFTTFDMSGMEADEKVTGRIDDLMVEYEGIEDEGSFILYITDGKIDTLEGFTTGDEWCMDYAKAALSYFEDDRRILKLE